MPTHRALSQEEAKGPLNVKEVTTASPAALQVQIRIKAVGLNPLDYKQIYDNYRVSEYPWIGGLDLSGVVTEVGEEVTHLQEGDRVATAAVHFIDGQPAAAFQEISSSDANIAFKIPQIVGHDAAASISINYYTAIVGLCLPEHLNLRFPALPHPSNPAPLENLQPDSDAPILVWGAGSGVGKHALQILRIAGYTNVLATAASHYFDSAKALGAKEVFDYKDEHVVKNIRAYLGDAKVLHAYDAISTPNTISKLIEIVNVGGTIATVTPEGQDLLPFHGAAIRRAGIQGAIVISKTNPEHWEFGRRARELIQDWLQYHGDDKRFKYFFNSTYVIPGGLDGGGIQRGLEMLGRNENHGKKIIVKGI
ncbi:chaperonin 10-like protein [Cantharellus anzutake]|uniref:chaperonin 10-like protein n=1 Tax=Cantharellus anzutake TaxID=1750568 RepID=UPI00190602AF|nr:chaperonin 10-like protein [Cantharellus anzutake]KAF8328820.1 chaperonin 10-like protein [Cantharellus anzutake]